MRESWFSCHLKGIGRLPFGQASGAFSWPGQDVAHLFGYRRDWVPASARGRRGLVQRAAAPAGGNGGQAYEVFVTPGEAQVLLAAPADAEQLATARAAPFSAVVVGISRAGRLAGRVRVSALKVGSRHWL